MFELSVGLLIGALIGGCLAYAVAAARVSRRFQAQLTDTERRASNAEGRASALQLQLDQSAAETVTLRTGLIAAQTAKTQAETERVETKRRLEEQESQLQDVRREFEATFKSLAGTALRESTEELRKTAKETFDKALAEAKGQLGVKQEAIAGLVSPLTDKLNEFSRRVQEIEKNRLDAYGGLREQVQELSNCSRRLQAETGNLVNALHTPTTVGLWGQMMLERVIELAGMADHCLKAQESVATEEGMLRPDFQVDLPGGRKIVIDAKASVRAYHESVNAQTEPARHAALAQHAEQVRLHMKKLSEKAYWNQFDSTPEFVVMFMPAESFLAAALKFDEHLLEDAIRKNVLLATPTVLLALLRAAAFGLGQERATRNAQEIRDLGKQLYDRMRIFIEAFAKVGKGIDTASNAFNQAAGSLTTRLLPSARRFKELGAAVGPEIPVIEPVQTAIQPVAQLDFALETSGARAD